MTEDARRDAGGRHGAGALLTATESPTAPFAAAGAAPAPPAPRAARRDDADPAPRTRRTDRNDRDDRAVRSRRAAPARQETPVPVRGVGWVLLVGGLVGAVVSLVLLVEKLDLLANPDYVPSCSIDPVLSCGTIMKTAQAAVLGFPNPVMGLLTFPLVAGSGALVLARVALPRWYWWSLQVGSLAGMMFVHWLIVQSLVVIHALCPYCMVAWAAVLAIFWFTTMHNLREGNLGGEPAGEGLARRHGWGLAVWYLAIVVAIVASFPDYFAAMVGLA